MKLISAILVLMIATLVVWEISLDFRKKPQAYFVSFVLDGGGSSMMCFMLNTDPIYTDVLYMSSIAATKANVDRAIVLNWKKISGSCPK